MLVIKNTATQINVLDGLDRSEEIMSEIEDMSIESSKAKKQIQQRRGKKNAIQRLWDNYQRCNKCVMGFQKEKNREKRRNV